jgi:CDP-diacylglycerol pyrophosphatase
MDRRSIVLAGLCFLASGALSMGHADGRSQSRSNRDILWRIVSSCLTDAAGTDYCKDCPAPLLSHLAACVDPSGQDPTAICRETSEVWDQTADYVAIRDQKMCGCPDGFVHGLALPRLKVSGIEDPSKPAGIWQFAWDEALKRIGAPDRDAILIAANPRDQRTQDQLHIHLVRLADGSRQRILDLKGSHVKDLAEVWTAAAALAAAAGLAPDGYGVAVIYDSTAGDFLVAVADDNMEMEYSAASCFARAQ